MKRRVLGLESQILGKYLFSDCQLEREDGFNAQFII